LSGKTVDLEEWARVLEDDWDDLRFDEEMQRHFGNAYYEEMADDSNEDADGSSKRKKKKKKNHTKPTWDDDLDIKDLVPDFDDEYPSASVLALSDEDEDQDEDEDENATVVSVRRNHKKEKADAKSTSRRDRRMIEALVDQSLPLDTAASSSKNFTPFRYRETSPITFGLTPLDILAADDSALNQFAGLKKLAAFRDPERKRKDKKKLGKKARLREWRKETFGREDGPVKEEIFPTENLKRKDVDVDVDMERGVSVNGGVKEGERRKKKKRGKKAPSGLATES